MTMLDCLVFELAGDEGEGKDVQGQDDRHEKEEKVQTALRWTKSREVSVGG